MTVTKALLPLVVLLTVVSAAEAQIVPAKTWFSPHQPLAFINKGEEPLELVLTDFLGRRIAPPSGERPPPVAPGDEIDLHKLYPGLQAETYLLYAVAPGDGMDQFVGTPHVIGIRPQPPAGPDAKPMVIKVEPLRYAVLETEKGSMTAAFYYDVAPNTVTNFLALAEGGFFDGLSFHRIVPGFVIQGGDPLNNTEGGPGYAIDAEFNDRPHIAGALSMAREGDPIERQGAMPRSEAANSAGSQFFIALDYATTRRLDGRYAVFGRLTGGMDVLEKLGASEIANPATGQPREPQVIRHVRVQEVTADNNPYARLFEGAEPQSTTRPAPG